MFETDSSNQPLPRTILHNNHEKCFINAIQLLPTQRAFATSNRRRNILTFSTLFRRWIDVETSSSTSIFRRFLFNVEKSTSNRRRNFDLPVGKVINNAQLRCENMFTFQIRWGSNLNLRFVKRSSCTHCPFSDTQYTLHPRVTSTVDLCYRD